MGTIEVWVALAVLTGIGAIIASFFTVDAFRRRRLNKVRREERELQVLSLGADMGFSSFTASGHTGD